MATFLTIWAPTVATLGLLWALWRQSRPIARVRLRAEAAMQDDPYPEELTFTVANTGAVPVTLSGLALTVYPHLLWRLVGIPQHWHNAAAGSHRAGVQLPKLLAAGEQWTGTVKVEGEILEELDAGRLSYRATFSHRRRPLSGTVRRKTLWQLVRG